MNKKMGCKTKVWGPWAWQYLHGLCKWLDTHAHDRALAIRVLSALVWIMPCIYCRRSASEFIKTPMLNPKLVGKPSGSPTYRTWAYNLHERVNKKLFLQDVEKSVDLTYWYNHKTTLSHVKYISVPSPKWLLALLQFYSYVLCDYPEESTKDDMRRKTEINRFLKNIGKLLDFQPLLAAVSNTQFSSITLDRRLHYAYTIMCQVVPKECECGEKSFGEQCKMAIVGGCKKIDPAKAGCH